MIKINSEFQGLEVSGPVIKESESGGGYTNEWYIVEDLEIQANGVDVDDLLTEKAIDAIEQYLIDEATR